VVPELVQEEFEVYIAKDETRLRHALKKFSGSIVFASINEGMKENAWEEWLRLVMVDAEITALDIGIIASRADENLRQKYLGQPRIRCGYTVLKADAAAAAGQLAELLTSVNAKGRRKYIRALTDKETNITVNFPMHGTFINGAIKDISVAGFSCSFAEDPDLAKNKLFEDIQIRLQSQILKSEGIVFGARMDANEKIYVILFTRQISPDVQTRIRKYIQSSLQNRMDSVLKGNSRN